MSKFGYHKLEVAGIVEDTEVASMVTEVFPLPNMISCQCEHYSGKM